jgi:hypothetical protein
VQIEEVEAKRAEAADVMKRAQDEAARREEELIAAKEDLKAAEAVEEAARVRAHAPSPSLLEVRR